MGLAVIYFHNVAQVIHFDKIHSHSHYTMLQLV